MIGTEPEVQMHCSIVIKRPGIGLKVKLSSAAINGENKAPCQ